MVDAGIRFADCTLDNYDATDNPAAMAACREMADGNLSGLLLSGGVGRGKTHLLLGIGRAFEREVIRGESFIDERGYRKLHPDTPARTVAYWPVLDLIGSLRAETANHDTGIIEGFCISASLFLLDDLGAERTTDFALEAIERIVDRRYRAMAPMAVATNLGLSALVDKYGDRSLSRWAHDGRIVQMAGRDRRPERGAK